MSWFLTRLPLLISFSILGGTWLAFVFTITVPEVLLHRHETWHFIEQLIVFNGLMGLTLLSLFTAATRSPGHPDQSQAPLDHVAESNKAGDLDRQSRLGIGASGGMAMKHISKSTPRPPLLTIAPPSSDIHAQPDSLGAAGTETNSALGPVDPDDVPLRFLRNSQWADHRTEKDRPSPLPFPSHGNRPAGSSILPIDGLSSGPSEDGGSFTPTISPFPLSLSPFVPNMAADAGDESDWTDEYEPSSPSHAGHDPDENIDLGGRRKGYWTDSANGGFVKEDLEMKLEEIESEVAGLLREEPRLEHGRRKVLMAKSNTGGPRCCRKCQSWKPDRCHHCRFCKRCVLKMDHHCVWLATCIGHRNYKPFLLFISYGTLLAIYITIEGVYQTYTFLTDVGQYEAVSPAAGGATPVTRSPMQVEFAPLVYMLLTMTAAFFTLAIGGLTTYHWFLVCNNLTTLEQISHTYPSALLPGPRPSASSISATAHHSTWKPDHLLTRPERRRLSDEAREINVYDLGWKRNIAQTLLGDSRRHAGMARWIKAFWPLSTAKNGDGHDFEYDEAKLERLRRLTEELRLGANREDHREGSGASDADDEAE